MASNDDGLGPEEKAGRWPDAEYRSWVQSQIAGQMLRRLGGITILSAVAVGASLWTAYQSARDQLIIDAANSAAEQLETNLRVEVAGAVVDQAKLIKEAERVFIETALPELVLKPEFIAPINAAISDGGGPQRIILEEAQKRMEDPDGSLSMRLLGMQLYALFYPTVKELNGDNIPPLRMTLYNLLNLEDIERHPELLAAVMDRYPMGEGFSVMSPDADCDTIVQTCREWDRLMIEAVLNYLDSGIEQNTTSIDNAIHNFFLRTPAELANTVLEWTRLRANTGAASNIEVALLSAQDPRIVRIAVAEFSAPTPSAPGVIATPNLRALGQLPLNAPLERIDRRAALRRVWNAISSEDKRAMFSVESLERSITQQKVGLRTSLTEDNRLNSSFGERIPNLFESSSFRDFLNREDPFATERHAIVALLRTDAEAIGAGPDTEWQAMFEEAVKEGHRTEALVAVGLRLIADASSGLNVKNVAIWLLEQTNSGKGQLMDSLRAIALRHVNDDEILSWASKYREFWKEEKPSTGTKTSRALFERLAEVSENFYWLEEFLALAAPERNFEDHLLYTIVDQYGGINILGNDTSLTNALRSVLRSRDAPDALYKILESRMVALSTTEPDFTDNALEILAPDLVANAERTTSLLALAPWIGKKLTGNAQRLHVQSGATIEIDSFGDEENSEIWFIITTNQITPLRITGAINGTVSIFDSERKMRFEHFESNERQSEIAIETSSFEKEYALRLRRDGDYISPIRIEAVNMFIPSTRDSAFPVKNSSQLFHATDDGGELWLLIEAKAGQTIFAETSAVENANINQGDILFLDTFIELYDLDNTAPIAEDDDGGDDNFSKLIHQSDDDGSKLLRIRPFSGGDFNPNTQFTVTIRVDN